MSIHTIKSNKDIKDVDRQTGIVVFTSNLTYSVRKGIVEIDLAIPGISWLIVLHSPRKLPAKLLKSQWRNFRRNGWRWIPYQTLELWQRLFTKNVAELQPPFAGNAYTRLALEARPNVRLIQVTNIHSHESLEEVKAFEPELGLSLAAPILRRPLFSIPKLGTINLHKGKLPNYRGMPPAFWELWNDEDSVGCTVHWIDDKLDTGPIIRQTNIKRAIFSTVRGLQLQLDEVGVDLMLGAVKDLLLGKVASHPQASLGKTYRKPTLAQIATLRRKLMRMQVPDTSITKRVLKQISSVMGFSLWHIGLNRIIKPRITVLLYHRVSDDNRDNLTVGIEQFDRQMALLRKNCQPLSIEQVLEKEDIPRHTVPLVAVTFDDGYLDNFVNAVPILIRHGIPAAFFVATGIVDTENRFPHDIQRGNPPIPVMKWDQLRKMRNWGFTIGSHSVNHIDCATEPEECVRAELTQSRDALHRELDITDPIFAYPYGGRQYMTQQRLELVKQVGYSACLSAYGGTNVGTIDRYNILRRGIHWEFSDSGFLFECLGLK